MRNDACSGREWKAVACEHSCSSNSTSHRLIHMIKNIIILFVKLVLIYSQLAPQNTPWP